MTAELDALIDRIRRMMVTAERRRPTLDEARQVGRLAVHLTDSKLSRDIRPMLSSGLRRPAATAATAAVPARTSIRQPAVDVCRLQTSAADRRPPERRPERRPLCVAVGRTMPLGSRPPLPPAAPAAHCGMTSLDNELKERLNQLRPSKAAVSEHAAAVKALCECILGGLKIRYPYNFYWRICNSGSYFDKTKILKPDEFDCMFTCEIRSEKIYHSSPSKSYAALRITSSHWGPVELLDSSDEGDSFVCPKAFKTHFRQQIECILQCIRLGPDMRLVLRPDNGRCPAVTVDVQYRSGLHTFSVDIVPAVRLLEWPWPARQWSSLWLPTATMDKIKNPSANESLQPCVVPKIHSTEFEIQHRRCKWWRLSFSGAEKEITLYADGKNSAAKFHTCRKDVLRLLKNDLFEFYRSNRFDDEMVCSYYIKTIFLHLLEERIQPKLWTSELLRLRYVEALSRTVSCLEDSYIEHYFISGENILSEKHIPEKQLDDIKRYFLAKQRCYSQSSN